MTRHTILWQAQKGYSFSVRGEGDPFTVRGVPTVTTYWFGTTVGMVARSPGAFGHWYSSSICGPVTAWRVAQILPRLRRMRNTGSDGTMSGLVAIMRGDRRDNLMRERASDLDLSVRELAAELDRLQATWPSTDELCSMWDTLPTAQQDELAVSLRKAAEIGTVPNSTALTMRIEISELRLRKAAEKKEREETLIANGLAPEASLHRLLRDIGVRNLLYPFGYGDLFEPTHFNFDDLDREVLRELIGKRSHGHNVPLRTSAKQPDDRTAHQVQGGHGALIHITNFGGVSSPLVILAGKQYNLLTAHWNEANECLELTLRPVGMNADSVSDTVLSIAELREKLGDEAGPLPPGTTPDWAKVATPAPRRRRTLFGRQYP